MEKKEFKIAIFIPAYNAATTLPIVLDRIPKDVKERVKEIFVIDNASPDNTYFVGIGYKEETGLSNLKVFRNETNKGYGGSQKRAYQYAIDQGFDAVVMLHGDAQYAPEKIAYLLEPIEKGEADMVFGSRIAGKPLEGGMPYHRYLGNRFLTWVENKVLDMNLTEFHSGFRVFSCEALKKVPFQLCADDYHFDTDIIIQFRIKGLRIVERPIPTYYGKEKSHVRIFSYGFNVLRSVSEYWLHKKGMRRVAKYNI